MEVNQYLNNEAQKIFSLHEERILAYKLFDDAHKIYLTSRDNLAFKKFNQIVDDITEEMKRISYKMNELSNNLKKFKVCDELCFLLKKYQDFEKIKLILTTELQIKKKEQLDSSDHVFCQKEINELNIRLKSINDEINQLLRTIKLEISF